MLLIPEVACSGSSVVAEVRQGLIFLIKYHYVCVWVEADTPNVPVRHMEPTFRQFGGAMLIIDA